ncbi:MAG: hypothetical protein HY904_22225 [Deltaproteobacteria bacterium]|nr:hypothetical protein [Deltaproteobacteria bacterium]
MRTTTPSPQRALRFLPLLLTLVTTPVLADEPPPAEAAAPEGPQKVAIGVYILSIGKFDISAGSYTVDFYLNLKSDRVLKDADVEFSNGRAQMELVQTLDGGKERFYRVLANLNTNIDLKRYPWDDQVLPIILEHKTRPASDWQFVVDTKQTGIDADVKFVGWELRGAEPVVTQHAYPVYDETYSQYHLNVKISRIRLPAALKTFLPILCFIIITFLSMLVTLEKIDNRLSMAIGILIASVMFHVSLTNTIPPVGYLTLIDKIMTATYVVVGSNLLMTVGIMRRVQQAAREKAQTLLERGYVLLPVVTLVAFLVAVVT